ncbi:IclR family transcriptional regulator [Halopolyspora algeriensis]|uniref:IclR family transcriptional regulator n=1 Tax=Halopolyspora algeriensis TaxID=1500506 RepID=A0A368VS01_9ACTN|nr:IclR family transcriptional regulator [Halopolyspora algeriensis]RCW44521.1 IclR family transcriptional regulator [Halopolyspora algeriensis]TQM55881.1 IclR family transcriptional regulator [Halopolyspora algeriensis]
MTDRWQPPQPGGSAAPRTATGKVLDVFRAFTQERPELTLTEIAHRSGLAMTTTHRLVGELAESGFLERSHDRRYRIGLQLWEIAALAPRGLALRELALPFLEDLYEVTHENVQLAVRETTEVVFVERIAGRRAVPVRTRVGGRFPMSATGVGLVLLAHAPMEVQEQVLSTPLPRFTTETVTDPTELRSMLAAVRRNGFAISDGQVTEDAVSVAAPVFGPDGDIAASVSLVVQGAGTRPASLIPTVRAAARGISRGMRTPGTW